MQDILKGGRVCNSTERVQNLSVSITLGAAKIIKD